MLFGETTVLQVYWTINVSLFAAKSFFKLCRCVVKYEKLIFQQSNVENLEGEGKRIHLNKFNFENIK